MTAIFQKVFGGISPKTDSELLSPAEAQVAQNVRLDSGTLKPSKLAVQVATILKSNPKTIYRFGQTETGDSQYWFSFMDDVDVVKSAINADTTERTYFTGDQYPKVTNSLLALTGGTNYPVAALRLGIPRPVDKAVAFSPNSTENPPPPSEARIYVVVFVNSFGEQGAPGPASDLVNVFEGNFATVENLPLPPAGNYNIPTKRIFRSSSGAVDAVFRFVAEVPASQTSYTDNVETVDLGEILTTEEYDPPPDSLVGLCLGANGVYAGFTGTDVYFTPPYKAFAWPVRYSLSVDTPIVGIAPLQQGFFIGTKANPYMVIGTDAETFSQIRYVDAWACVSKRSLVSMMGGVVYASTDGLVLATESGLKNLTEGFLTRDQWQQYKPESMHCHQINGKYVAFYNTGTVSGSLVFDFTGKQAMFTTSDEWYSAAYSDRFRDALFAVTNLNILKTDSGANKTLQYRSRAYRETRPTNFGFGQLIAKAYPVTMRVFAGGTLRHTQTVLNADPFRLPAGFMESVWEIEIECDKEVRFFGLANSAREFQQI